jgi:hypothetical protein
MSARAMAQITQLLTAVAISNGGSIWLRTRFVQTQFPEPQRYYSGFRGYYSVTCHLTPLSPRGFAAIPKLFFQLSVVKYVRTASPTIPYNFKPDKVTLGCKV